jgi:predicted transcriptional regulator
MIPASVDRSEVMGRCEFLTNHAKVLLCIADEPNSRLRDIAAAVGVTERAAHRLVSELVEDGYIARERQGRRNSYRVDHRRPLPHPLREERQVGELLRALQGADAP